MNSDKNFVPAPSQFNHKSGELPQWMTAPTLEQALIERIRGGGTLDEIKEYYRFMREIEHDQAKTKFIEAMAKAQSQMRSISRDMDNPSTKSKYASLAAVDDAIRPIYSELGIVVSFDTRSSAKGDTWIDIIAIVGLGNYSEERILAMPADGIGAKGGAVMTRTHATGSALTYGRRQLLKMIFNLAEADDDGNAAPGKQSQSSEDWNKPISQEQVNKLTELIERSGRKLEAFKFAWKIDDLGELRVQDYANAERALNKLITEKQDAATNA